MVMNYCHPYHLVDESPWPFYASLNIFSMVIGGVFFFQFGKYMLLILSFLITIVLMLKWWLDVVKEGISMGQHSFIVEGGLRIGMILFIVSEVMFFFSFFWMYFHVSLIPNEFMGSNWPPQGVIGFNPYGVPLLNTIILLSSGSSVTASHHYLMSGYKDYSLFWIFLACMMGLYFTILQGYEYIEASFSMSDSVYGSSFFLLTGFHGMHVIIGSLFLFVSMIRIYFKHFSSNHHLGFEASCWYWHFVDVVWLFLYMFVYVWSGY